MSLHKCCFCPFMPLPCRRRPCVIFTRSHDSEVWKVLTTPSDVEGRGDLGQGVGGGGGRQRMGTLLLVVGPK